MIEAQRTEVSMFKILERTNDVGRRQFVVLNERNGKELGAFRFYDDAVRRVNALCGLTKSDAGHPDNVIL